MRLALWNPEIPGNVGTLLRLGACWKVPVDVIGPLGFFWGSPRFKRSSMDYLSHVEHTYYPSWKGYHETQKGRHILLDPTATLCYTTFSFTQEDVLWTGKESSGFSKEVRLAVPLSLSIPMDPGMRSLNMAVAAAVVLGEALRQLGTFPRVEGKTI